MNQYILAFRKWYELRAQRERFFTLLLCWALLYLLFNVCLFNGLDKRKAAVTMEINLLSTAVQDWNKQIAIVNQLAQDPLYKKWLNQYQLFNHLQGQSSTLLQVPTAQQWQSIIRAILQEKKNVTLVQIKNFPETLYSPANIPMPIKVYEQRFLVSIYSSFFDAVNYLQYLEGLLSNIHWNSLTYQVIQYPVAKVEMEFSIFYEKNG